MGYVIRAVTKNLDQVIGTIILAAVIIWMYLIFGTYYFGFGSYDFGESVGDSFTLAERFWEHIDYGLGNPP
eukprot:gene1999-3890_t